jgi:aminoglycoside phosphotransferase (APT) family kinase protein
MDQTCLPAQLRGPGTTITPVSAGFSGAEVYRVQAAGQAYVLKISPEDAAWLPRLQTQKLAARAGLAPRIVHVDEERRAVLSEFVVDRSFPAYYSNPATRSLAIAKLGQTLRRVHQLPAVAIQLQDRREMLESMNNCPVPAFVTAAVQSLLQEEPPPPSRPLVLSHNDVNPSNLAYDGETLFLLDWDSAGAHDYLYDLATVALFLRMDEASARNLLSAYDEAPSRPLPPAFTYYFRLVGALCGSGFLTLGHRNGHRDGGEALDLGDFYQRLRSGQVSLTSPEGQWHFGLALVKTSLTLSRPAC